MVEGYFVILKLFPGTYWLYSKASAPRERSGPYFSELLYQIEVTERKEKLNRGLTSFGAGNAIRPARNERVFRKTLLEKYKISELNKLEFDRFRMFLTSPSSINEQAPSETDSTE